MALSGKRKPSLYHRGFVDERTEAVSFGNGLVRARTMLCKGTSMVPGNHWELANMIAWFLDFSFITGADDTYSSPHKYLRREQASVHLGDCSPAFCINDRWACLLVSSHILCVRLPWHPVPGWLAMWNCRASVEFPDETRHCFFQGYDMIKRKRLFCCCSHGKMGGVGSFGMVEPSTLAHPGVVWFHHGC